MYLIRRYLRTSVEKFERDSQTWGLTQRQALVIAAIPIIIVLAMTVTVPFFELFVWLTAEDSVIEWGQFLLVFFATLIFAWLAVQFIRRQQRGIGALYLLVALGLFFIAGEEIAWGQRMFGWGTPEALEAINVQNETTLHNIGSAHRVFIYAVMLGGLFGAAIPLLWSAFWAERPRSSLSYLLVPPLCLVPAFLMPFGYRFTRLAFDFDARFSRLIFPITKFSEVTELCLYFGLALLAWLNLRRSYQERPARPALLHPEKSSTQLPAQ